MSYLPEYKNALAVTPNNTLGLRAPSVFLSWTDATGGPGMGTVYIDTVAGQINVPIILPAGQWRIPATKVYSTGTTATNIVEYY